ncbi:MAG TPA: PilZ domain-containing protein, partial [Planctomycetota bacterium]|nr:PilZ domain-containing protein [Planctomycetota bacterium]
MRISTIDAETDPETGKPYFLHAAEVCENLSRGGLFVLTHEAVRPGSRLLVELELPGSGEVQAIGRVAWSRAVPAASGVEQRPGIGIEFLGGSTEGL